MRIDKSIYGEVGIDSSLKELITQNSLKLESAVECLISYRTDINPETRRYIENFFKEIKQLPSHWRCIADTGRKYELKLKEFKMVDIDTHEYFSLALEGLSKVKTELNELKLDLESQLLQSSESYGEMENWGKEYTNITSNGKILIVDDDILILSIMNRALEMNGYEVIVTSKPQEAGDIVKSGDIDLAMVDLIMPELDGFQVFENMREYEPELPVIFITGRDHTETKVDALKRGVEDYIVKPFKVEEVLARVDGILKRKSDYKHNLNVDELTGAYTRKHFASSIGSYLNKVKSGRPVSLSFLDLDKFKDINDTYGHLIGDEILKRLVDDTKSYMDCTKVFRFGGDEFLLVMEDKREDEARKALDSLRFNISEKSYSFEDIEDRLSIGISIGVTEIEADDLMSKILDRADKALYRAKEGGRNRVVAYSEIEGLEEEDKRVLIVDVENVASNLVKNRLKSLGYGVSLAEGLDDVEESLKASTDLVILDFKTYSENKERLNELDILGRKVLLMISEGEKGLLRPSDVFHIDEIMVKPISVNEVEKMVRRIMS